MKKVLKKKLTGLIVICSMILTVVAFPVAVLGANLKFDPGEGGIVDGCDPGVPFVCTTEDDNHISRDNAELVFGALKEGYKILRWKITEPILTGQQGLFADSDSLCNFEFESDQQYTLTAEWQKTITITVYGVNPLDENSHENILLDGPSCTLKEDWVRSRYPDRNGYTVIGLEYAGKGGTPGNQYVYGTQINEDTELKLLWKKVEVPGGGGGSDSDTPTKSDPSGGGGGGGVPNPKTGDLGVVTYVGIIVVSALGTAGVVKLLKKEK